MLLQTGAKHLILVNDTEGLSLTNLSPLIESLPDFVRTVVKELVTTASTQSIWLVGSRANDDAQEGSDWDLLVFSNNEPHQTVRARSPEVDVIHVGPSGVWNLEGESGVLDFADWQWRQESATAATYISKDFPTTDQEPVVADRPFQTLRIPKRAIKLFKVSIK